MEARHHSVEIGDDQIAVLTLDTEGKSVNVLSSDLVAEVTNSLNRLAAMGGDEVRGLLIRSAKPNQFIAGANIDEIFSITQPAEATEKARDGQALMQLIESLPFPTVAAIDGPCLGGGLELALACTYRVGGDGPHVRLQLPEVQLGIIPGFGGTQRMPSVVGFLPSIDLIVSGKPWTAKRAFKAGLLDDLAPTPILDSIARKWLKKGSRRRSSAKIPLWQKVLQRVHPFRRWVLNQARKRVIASTGGMYPAPLAAIDVLEATYRNKEMNGYEIEAKRVGGLIASPVSKSLIRLFLATEEIRRTKGEVAPRPVQKVGVIGAGVMGAGIAQLVAAKGRSVRLREVSVPLLAKGWKGIRQLNAKDVQRGKCDRRDGEARNSRIAPTTDWSGFRRADFVVEAVVEDLAVKKEVFAELAQRVSADAILATNTSALSLAEIASSVSNPERVIGMHFFNPVHRMPLVEVVKGEKTSPVVISKTVDFALSLGKTPVIVADRPGFFVNRVLGIYLNEACRAAEEGIPISEMDAAMKAFGMPMGPFELMDEVGLDVAQKVGLYLATTLAHFPTSSALLEALRTDGRTGKKGGRGFYIHTKSGRKLDQSYVDRTLRSLKKESAFSLETEQYDLLLDRFVLLMVNEAALCLEENVIGSSRDVDVATVLGLGFAPFRGGLYSYAATRGFDKIRERLKVLAGKYGPHFTPAREFLKGT